ncbi:MAG: biotin/lipoyl-binding protein, partial [Gemmatimonadales bacterium]|nr:biotin/lipoyl-binding protein [Gemmatimonadales bacterium]
INTCPFSTACPGVVERVAVTPGQAVEKGQVLIGFAGASPGK